MYTIKIMNEFLHGPIWVYDDEGFIREKCTLIDRDNDLRAWNEEARMLYDSCYSFGDDEPCKFDDERYQQIHNQMSSVIEKIIARLNEINDGSFYVENHIELR